MWGAKVVLHIRLGDAAERALPTGYYARAVSALRAELSGSGRLPPLFRLQTNGRPQDLKRLLAQPGMNGSDIVLDPSRFFGGDPGQRSPLSLSFHRMVSADYFVMSRSALSVAAALLSQGTVLFPACWKEHRRPLASWRLWPCCADEAELPKGSSCFSEGNRAKWPFYSHGRETWVG